jgi:methyl-accepting chemotaxis protein
MLLNEFLKEHKKVEEQTETVQEQANRMEAQAKEISELKSALKDVTARLDAKGL